MKIVDHVDRAPDGMNREIWVVVEVTEQRDGKAVQSGGPSPQPYLFRNNSGTVRFNQESVCTECRHPSNRRQLKKLTSANGKKRQAFSGSAGLCDYRPFNSSITRQLPFTKPCKPDQKLKVACKSRRRFAAEPGENGPPCSAFETPKYLDPRTPPGLATFTLLKALRKLMPRVRL